MPFWPQAGRADGRDVARARRQRPEHDLMQYCRQDAAQLGFRAWHLAQARPTQQSAGWCDDVYTGGPRLVAVEYKVGRNQQTPAQRAFQAAWEASGGAYFVIRSRADLIERLSAEKGGPDA